MEGTSRLETLTPLEQNVLLQRMLLAGRVLPPLADPAAATPALAPAASATPEASGDCFDSCTWCMRKSCNATFVLLQVALWIVITFVIALGLWTRNGDFV